jgi:hypothetical protein
MQKLPMPSVGTRDLVPASGKALRPSSSSRRTSPQRIVARTDIDIPRIVWSSWKEDGRPRELRRALNDSERRELEVRHDELAGALVAHTESDVNRIALAITDMYGSFPAMRARDDETVIARIDSLRRLLAPYPCWAIEQACASIRAHGVYRDGRFDQQWPPSDAEIVHEIRQELAGVQDRLGNIAALLKAEVE